MAFDIRHDHGSLVHVVRACHNDDGFDLIAIGGEHTVEVLLISEQTATPLATFQIGCRITALAWSSRTLSPSHSDQWLIELAAATSDFGLHLLTKMNDAAEDVFPFGGGLSGHHGTINDMTFCGGRTPDSAQYVATVSDDKMLMVWDLHPALDIPSLNVSVSPDPIPHARPQPTALALPFPHPLGSIAAHPTTATALLVADARGGVFLVDWREEFEVARRGVVELVEPRALAGAAGVGAVGVDWRQDAADIVGGVFGSRLAIWDLSKLHGGKPTYTGLSFSSGARRFRWHPTQPTVFAISPVRGNALHIHNAAYPHAEPAVFAVRPGLEVRDFDWVGGETAGGDVRLAVAAGRGIVVGRVREKERMVG